MSYPFYSFLSIQAGINFIPHFSKIKSQFFVRESRLTLPKHLKVLLMITYIHTEVYYPRGYIGTIRSIKFIYYSSSTVQATDLYGNNPLKLFLVL